MPRPSPPLRVAAPPETPLVIFDGDCGFCRLWIVRWKSVTGDRVDYAPSQEVEDRFPEIPKEAFERSVQLVLPSGAVFEGAEAAFRALAFAPGRGALLRMYLRIPGFAAIVDLSYRFIAKHRGAGFAVTRLLWGNRMEEPSYLLASTFFIRLVGVCFFAAFVSLWVQVEGLIGSDGILPVTAFLDWVRGQTGLERYWRLPTLCWLNSSDAFLQVLCTGGAVASLLLIAGFAPSLCLALLWAFYLSLSIASQVFLEFQWDTLLLEAGFLAIFLAPLKLRAPLRVPPPPPVVRLLLLWLLFRLTFTSAAVKLASGDPTWRSLTALQYHYETQPLPPWTAWFMHQLPPSFQTASAAFLFFAELVVPFLIFGPRRLRLFAFSILVVLQILIVATGNYAFFNFLAIALCVLLLDDTVFPGRWRSVVSGLSPARAAHIKRNRTWPVWVIAPLTTVVLLVTSVQMASRLSRSAPWPDPVARLVRWTTPFRSTNSYGLFAVMTTSRPEIIVEGSNDGSAWLPFEFRWKPGDLLRRPRFVAPHQPRLDWQMWFAALGSYEENPWFVSFLARLLQGSTDVLRLLEKNPFPDRPPRYVRAVVYDYRFTDSATRRQAGAWWRREQKGLYCPVLSREMLGLQP